MAQSFFIAEQKQLSPNNGNLGNVKAYSKLLPNLAPASMMQVLENKDIKNMVI